MNGKIKKYLIVDVSCFKKKVSGFYDSGIFAKELFDKNNVPLEYQKNIIKVNLPMIFDRYEAKELTTGFSFDSIGNRLKLL